MKSSLFRVLLPCVLLMAWTGFGWAATDSPAVRDEGGFFTPDTVQKANEEILALQKQFKVDLSVETVAGVPADKVQQVREMKTPDRDQFFSTWALERASAAGIHGVYILICKNPGHLQVEAGKQTQKQAFTLENCNKLRDLLLARFREKDYDKGLLAAVDLVRDTLQKNLGPTQITLVAREVKDSAGFFSPAAVQKANAELQSLPREPGKDVAIETFPTPRPAQIQEVEKMSPAARSKFFADWAEERSREGKLDGVLVLICKHPGHSQVEVRGSAARKLFTPAEINRIDKELLARFRNHEYDQGLADLVRTLHDKLAPAASVVATPSPPVRAPDTVPTPVAKPAPAAEVAMTPSPPVKAPDIVPATVTKPESKQSAAMTPAPPVKAESPARGPDGPTAAKDDSPLAKAKQKATELGKTATELGQTQYPTWMWVAGIIVGLLVLWILIGILRALFGGGPRGPSAQAASPQPMPNVNPGYPPQTPGANYVRLPQGGGYPAAQQGGGYPMSPQVGYPVPQAPPQPRGGGGFVSGVLGGMLGAAAGNWVYDSFRRPGNAPSYGGASAAPLPPNPSYRPSAPPPAGSPSSAAGDGYNTGGDFDASAATGALGAGGDFDSSAPAQASAGGDFDSSVAAGAVGAGGDFDSPSPAQASAGGDFDTNDTQALASDNAGGDFGDQLAAQTDGGSGGGFDVPAGDDQASSGGSFDSGDSSSGEVAGNDSGGDFGDSPS